MSDVGSMIKEIENREPKTENPKPKTRNRELKTINLISTMKKLTTLICTVLIAVTLHAQKTTDVPAFGKVEKAELEMKECEFDKKAEAVVLFDDGEMYCDL